MSERYRMKSRRVISREWGTFSIYEIDYLTSSGKWQRQEREIYDRGHAAAILLHDSARDKVVLVRQFRLPVALDGDDGFLLEVCAGLIDAGETPDETARREAFEETGLSVTDIEHVSTCYASPGSVTELMNLYIGAYDGPPPSGGGEGDHDEDVETIELPVSEALKMLQDKKIRDAKTVILLQHLALQSRSTAG